MAPNHVCLAIGIYIHRTAIFTAHFVLRCAGVRSQMHVNQHLQRYYVRLEGNDNGFRISVMRGKGFDEPLLHFGDAPKRLEHCFRAPMAAAAEADLHLVD